MLKLSIKYILEKWPLEGDKNSSSSTQRVLPHQRRLLLLRLSYLFVRASLIKSLLAGVLPYKTLHTLPNLRTSDSIPFLLASADGYPSETVFDFLESNYPFVGAQVFLFVW